MLEHYQYFIFTHLKAVLFFLNEQLTPQGCLILSGLLLLILFILKLEKSPTPTSSQDIHAIAGDDVMATQLDLARAFLEMDKKALAMPILAEVKRHGNPLQKQEAQQLCELH